MLMSLHGHRLINDRRLEDAWGCPSTTTRDPEPREILVGQFFGDLLAEELWTIYKWQFSKKIQAVREDAERICRHEFNLLGTGLINLGKPIDWHIDPVSGYRWPKKLFTEVRKERTIPRGDDLKFPWELSRMQHLPTLGKAFRLTRDNRYAREVVDQVNHWLDDNPCPYGVNWTCAMDVAIRMMNIIWAYLFIRDASLLTDEFRARLVVSLRQHGQFIWFNLEFGLREDGSVTNGNHYLTNIVGLLFLGLVCPELKLAEQWKAVGLKALIEEMDRQVHPDGVNFESSTSYHRLVLELFTAAALLCRTNDVVLPNKFWQRLERMFEFVLYITRPDGKVPVVGDADDGRIVILSNYGSWDRRDFRYLLSVGAVLFNREDMKAHAGGFSEDAFWLLGSSGVNAFAALKEDVADVGSKAFPDAGFYVMRQGDRYLLACCGEVGTDGLGNHKHNDLLSFELFAGDKAFIVDPGTYVYTRDANWRNVFRSTKSHNTVVIDGQEQNRFDPSQIFRMSPDAKVIIREWVSTPDLDRLDVEHTGYTRLHQPVRHRRTFCFRKGAGTWEILDILTGPGDHTADWYFHFDSGIALSSPSKGLFRTSCNGTNLEMVMRSESPLEFNIVDGWVSRQYGSKLPAKILHLSGTFNGACRTDITMRAVS
jgi:hypothetical protein